MNLQRREEIRAIAECPNDRHWAQEMRRAVAELLAHIDALEQTAAERVIADGSRGPTPDYTGEGSAWVPPVEARAVVVPALTDEDLNSYSMDCDERDAVEFGYNLAASRITPAGRVTIPPLTGGEIEARLLRLFPDISEDDPLRESCFKDSRWAYNLAASRLRAIPADRVLGEGMVAVDRHELALLRKIAGMWCPPFGVPHNPESVALFDALRANQGGAAT